MEVVALAVIDTASIEEPLKAALNSTDWLTDPEQQRVTQLAAPKRRLQFLVGHGLVRQLLAAHWGGDPWRDWPLGAPDLGPPCLLPHARQSRLQIAISHSASWVAVAVAPTAVGLDIETPNERRSLRALLDAIGTDDERARFNALVPTDQAREFYRIWTLKEAWLKKRHEGLALGRLPLLQTRPAGKNDAWTARVWQFSGLTISCLAPADACLTWWAAPRGLQGSELPQPWAVDDLLLA